MLNESGQKIDFNIGLNSKQTLRLQINVKSNKVGE